MTINHAHSKPLFNKLKILTINDIHKLEVAKYMHKVSKNCSEITNISKFIPLSTFHNLSTRFSSGTNYFINRYNTKQGSKSIQILGPKIRSEVPSDIKLYSLKTFIIKYKKYLLQQYMKSG